MKTLLREYSNIKELTEAIEDLFQANIIDAWIVGTNYHCLLGSEINHIEQKDIWKHYCKGGLHIVAKMPQ